jgi:uncharacterized glyoxalase superfamily protein PhnB
MITKLADVTIVVHDEDEALQWYTEKLGFVKRADVPMGPGSRWLTVSPTPTSDVEIVLQKPNPAVHGDAHAETLSQRIGQGTTWVLEADDCRATYDELSARAVTFRGPPKDLPWGVSAVFEDLYGNKFNLLSRP